MPRSTEALVQITKINDILTRTGVSSFCNTCIHGPEGGCCQGCANLGPDGCINKPIACALWLCNKAALELPQAARELNQLARTYPYEVAHGYRHISLRAEENYYVESTDTIR